MTCTPFPGVPRSAPSPATKFPTEILIGLNRDNPQLHDVYRLDLLSGAMTLEVKNPGFAGWLADDEMVVRQASRRSPAATCGSWCASGC